MLTCDCAVHKVTKKKMWTDLDRIFKVYWPMGLELSDLSCECALSHRLDMENPGLSLDFRHSAGYL